MSHCLAYLLTHIQVQGNCIMYNNINYNIYNQYIAQYLSEYEDYLTIVHFKDDHHDNLFGVQNVYGTMIDFKEVKSLIYALSNNNIQYEL